MVILAGKLMKKVFFGELRAAEFEVNLHYLFSFYCSYKLFLSNVYGFLFGIFLTMTDSPQCSELQVVAYDVTFCFWLCSIFL